MAIIVLLPRFDYSARDERISTRVLIYKKSMLECALFKLSTYVKECTVAFAMPDVIVVDRRVIDLQVQTAHMV